MSPRPDDGEDEGRLPSLDGEPTGVLIFFFCTPCARYEKRKMVFKVVRLACTLTFSLLIPQPSQVSLKGFLGPLSKFTVLTADLE